MDDQVFVRLENGQIIPIQGSDIQGSSFIIQQPEESVSDQNEVQPIFTDGMENGASTAENVVYIVNQEGSNLDGMQFTVFGGDGTDSQTLTLQTILSGDTTDVTNTVNYADVTDNLSVSEFVPTSSIPGVAVQDLSAIEAITRITFSEEHQKLVNALEDHTESHSRLGTAELNTTTDTSTTADNTQQSDLDNVNFKFYCQECGAATDNIDNLKQHLLTEHGILELDENTDVNDTVTLLPSCNLCSKTFITQDELNEHMASCKDSGITVAEADDSGSQEAHPHFVEFKCRHCQESFSSRDDLVSHFATSHPGKSLQDGSNTNMFTKCPYCHKMYVQRGVNKALINHILTAHPDKYPLEDGMRAEDKISCKFCGADFYWKKSLIRHVKQNHPDEYVAEGDTSFDELGAQDVLYPGRRVRRTTTTLNDEDDIEIKKCPSCPKAFMWEKSLKRHMMDVHKEEYNAGTRGKLKSSDVFKCPFCSMVSKYACAVRKHVGRKHASQVRNIDVHKMEIPRVEAAGIEIKTVDTRPVEVRLNLCPVIYRCPFCNYASKQTSNLHRHLVSKNHGHIFTSKELKQIKLSSFKVKNEMSAENESAKIDGTSDTTLPKLKLKGRALDMVTKKLKILKQRNLADKENEGVQENPEDYSELDIDNIIDVAEEETDESLDEEDMDEDAEKTNMGVEADKTGTEQPQANNTRTGVKPTKTGTEVQPDKTRDKVRPIKTGTEVERVVTIGHKNNDSQAEKIERFIDNSESDNQIGNLLNDKLRSNEDEVEEKGRESRIIEIEPISTSDTANETLENDTTESYIIDIPVFTVVCVVCEKVFDNFTQFKKHLNTHTNLKVTFQCKVCQLEFKFSKDILNHLRKQHDIVTTEIEARYVFMDAMRDNRKPLLSYECPYCDFMFSQSDPLNKHVVEDHMNCIDAAGIKLEADSILPKTRQTVVTAYRCQFCECHYRNITDIVKHMGIVHTDVEKIGQWSSVRKSGRKRKVPKWLDGEIELTPVSKRSKIDEDSDVNDDDWNDKPYNVTPRKKSTKKDKTHTGTTSITKKQDLLDTRGDDSRITNDKDVPLNDVHDVSIAESSEVAEVSTNQVTDISEVLSNEINDISNAESLEQPKDNKPKPGPKPGRKKRSVKASTTEPATIVNETLRSKCPHCDFTAKRASALTFHINFKHAGLEIKDEPIDSADETDPDFKPSSTNVVLGKENTSDMQIVSNKGSVRMDGTLKTVRGLDVYIDQSDDVLDEDIDFGDSDDDYVPFENDKGEQIGFGFSAAVKLGCPYCEDGYFSTLLLVKEHIQAAHPECVEEFSLADVKTKVELDHESDLCNKLSTCYKCKKKFKGILELKAHMKVEHGHEVDVKFNFLNKKQKKISAKDAFNESKDENCRYLFRCSFCSSHFATAESAIQHAYSTHSQLKQLTILIQLCDQSSGGFKCPYCELTSRYKRCIIRHVQRAHQDKKQFSTQGITKISSSADSSVTIFQCTFCEFESQSKSSVEQHLAQIHPLENGMVTIGMSDSCCLDYLLEHEDSNDYFKCPECDRVYITAEDMEAHMSTSHQTVTINDIETCKVTREHCLDADQIYACPVCYQGSKWLIAVVRHMKISHPELIEYKLETYIHRRTCTLEEADKDNNLIFRCDVCNFASNTQRGFNHHSRAVHGMEVTNYRIEQRSDTTENLAELYCCPYCEFKSDTKMAIKTHVSSDHPDMKKFKTKNIVRVAENGMDNSDNGGYKCPYCPVVNRWRKSVVRHIRTNHYGKPYDVDIQYQTNASLTEFGKTLRKSSKIIECLLCGTLRRSAKTMKQHFQTKHRKYTKDFLNKEYTNVKYSKAKITSETVTPKLEETEPVTDRGRTLDHDCVLCGAKYVWKKSLLVHIKNHHNSMYDIYRTIDSMVEIVSNATEQSALVVKQTAVKHETIIADEEQPVPSEAAFTSKKTLRKKKKTRCKKCQKTVTTAWSASCHQKLHHQVHKRFHRYACTDCCLSFPTAVKLKIHRTVKHKYQNSGPWQCTGCNYRCKFWSVLQSHFMRVHAPKHVFSIDHGVYKCEMCSKEFASSRFLKQHLTMHKNTRKHTYQCSVCGKVFLHATERDTHMEHKHPDVTEMCDVCGDMMTKRNLKTHIKTHTDPHLTVVCPFCQKSVFEKTLNGHVLTYHSDVETCACEICSSDVSTTPVGSYKCKICLKNTCHNLTLYVHTKLNHATTAGGAKVFQCDLCPDRVFSSKHLRDAHCHKNHKKDTGIRLGQVTDTSPKAPRLSSEDPTTHVIHIGQDEGKQFLPKLSETSMNAVLKELIVYERGSKCPHKCLLCGRNFTKLKYIKLHVRRAHVRDEDQPYRCKVCGSGFVRLTEFRKHTRSHSDFRPYKCNYCDKAFKQQANLADHYRVHTNTKSYQCFICKTSFRQRGGLTSHVVFHDTLKPYKCMYCSKGYTTRGELSRHMQKYNQDGDGETKSYQCHLCDNSFPHYPMLMKHIELHSPEKPFQCQACNASFASYVSMYFHKVDHGHFYKEDVEQGMRDLQQRGRKFRANKMESRLLLQQEYGGQNRVHDMTGDIVYVNQAADGSLQTDSGKPVEIIVEEFGKDRVVHVQGNEPEHEELLSIAKQLTQLSGFTETEVHTSTKKNMFQEEDEIIKHMLDADEDVLASLNKPKVYNNTGVERNTEQTRHIDDGNEDIYTTEGHTEVIPMEGEMTEVHEEENVSYANQTLPTTMEELVSIVSQNVNNDGNEQVMAYQREDGSMIYVCLSEGDNTAKEIVLEQSAEILEQGTEIVEQGTEMLENGSTILENTTEIVENSTNIPEQSTEILEQGMEHLEQGSLGEEQYVTQEADTEITGTQYEQIDGQHNETAEQEIVPEDYTNDTEDIGDNENDRMECEIEETYVEHSTLTSEIQSDDPSTTHVQLINVDGVVHEYVQVSADGLQQVSVGGMPISELNEITDGYHGPEEGNEQLAASSSMHSYQTSEIQVPQDGQYASDGTIVDKPQDDVEVTTEGYAEIQPSEDQIKEVIVEAEETHEALLQRSQLAQYLTGHVPMSSSSTTSAGSTHMVFTGEGLKAVTKIPPEASETETASNSLLNIAAAAASQFDENGKQLVHHSGNVKTVTEQDNAVGSNTTQGVETVLEYQINEARFIKEELLDPSYSGVVDGDGKAGEVMFVSDNIYTYSMNEKKYICLHCGQKIKTFKNLKNHIRRHAPESSRIHKCAYCDKRFVTKNEWKRHTWSHTGERNYECKQCGKKFIQPGHLSDHMRVHSGNKPYGCNMCKQSFVTNSQLKLHWNRRHSDNKIPCEQCGKIFKTNIDLKTHIGLYHSGLKRSTRTKQTPQSQSASASCDHICDVCGMAFMKKSSLKLHLEKHNLENSPETEEPKLFSCEICDSTFKSKYYATEHMKGAHGNEKNEVCETCGMAFQTKSLLRRHKDTVHSKWKCKSCDKSFSSRASLAYHVGSKH